MIPKYRAWVKKDTVENTFGLEGQRMFQVNDLEWDCKGEELLYIYCDDPNLNCDGLEFKIQDVELLQFTGLYDKNKTKERPLGTPIYEGDIISFDWFDEKIKGEVKLGKFNVEGGANTYPSIYGFYVKYNLYAISKEGESVFGLTESLYDIKSSIEVIGTVQQNPELLGDD